MDSCDCARLATTNYALSMLADVLNGYRGVDFCNSLIATSAAALEPAVQNRAASQPKDWRARHDSVTSRDPAAAADGMADSFQSGP